jgi:hypothetical protein
MASAYHHKNQRNRGKKRSIGAPFDIQVPSSLRDPTDETFPNEQLLRLRDNDNARVFALEHLHDHERFAQLWNSTTPSPNTRRLMRKVVQIQTINAVCNG